MTQKIIAVLGLGIFGKTLAKELNNFNQEVLAVDINLENIEDIADEVTRAVQGDMTDLEFLEEIGIANCDTVIVATGNSLESSVLAIMHCKKLGVKKIIAKARSTIYEEVLYEIGANHVISPERESGRSIASNLLRNTITDIIQIDSTTSIIEFKTPKQWVGKTVIELDIRKKYDINLIGTKENQTSQLKININFNEKIEENQIFVAITNKQTFEKFDYLRHFINRDK